MTESTSHAETLRPTREDLIALCDRAVVPQRHWHDRDSAGAQRQLGEGRALLLAGCEFKFDEEEPLKYDCWWIEITYKGFDYFEVGDLSTDTCYIPTAERLDASIGKDWY